VRQVVALLRSAPVQLQATSLALLSNCAVDASCKAALQKVAFVQMLGGVQIESVDAWFWDDDWQILLGFASHCVDTRSRPTGWAGQKRGGARAEVLQEVCR
jgi:hypothetical protein